MEIVMGDGRGLRNRIAKLSLGEVALNHTWYRC